MTCTWHDCDKETIEKPFNYGGFDHLCSEHWELLESKMRSTGIRPIWLHETNCSLNLLDKEAT